MLNSCSVTQSCLTLCYPHGLQHARLPCPSLSPGVSSVKLMSIESMMPSNHLILCCPLILLPSVFSRIGVFSNELALHIKGPKYWSFIFSSSPSNEYSGLISFRIEWFDLFAIQGTHKGLIQTPQLESISSVLSLLCDYYKNNLKKKKNNLESGLDLQSKLNCQAPLSMGFSRQEYWRRLPFPSPGDPRDCIQVSCIAGRLLHCRQIFLLTGPGGKPKNKNTRFQLLRSVGIQGKTGLVLLNQD